MQQITTNQRDTQRKHEQTQTTIKINYRDIKKERARERYREINNMKAQHTI